jgi:SAM-dependent methyltransferase
VSDTAPATPGLSESELCPPDLLAGQEAAFARDVARLLARRAEFVAVACPACDADEPRPGLAKWGFEWATCGRCLTLYMSPRPSESVMAGYYADSENYAYWAEHIFPASEAARREKVHRPWLARILALCERFGVAPGTLVEVGPGFGTFAALASADGGFGRVVAVEPTPQLAAACRERGVEVVERRVEDAVDALPPADVVVAFEVIEHLFAPARLVEGCARLLRPGGLLVLSCPNSAGFDIQALGAESLAVDPEHVNLFTPASLTGLVERHGFTVVSATTPGRLDAEFVREAALAGRVDLSGQPLLRRVLLQEWERLGGPFQAFLAEHGLSSHLWVAARRGAA